MLFMFGAFAIFWFTKSMYFPQVAYADRETVKTVIVTSTSTPPVLERIMKCESGNRQFAANGQVLLNVNTNGSVDMGIGQINSIWFKTASKMGYDLTKESDNRAFTRFLFDNYGSEPWNASKTGCWAK